MHSNINPNHNLENQKNGLSEECFSSRTRNALLESLISDYQIRIEKDTIVTLTLPAGQSPITFLQSSQNLSQLVFNRPHIASWQFEKWLIDASFNEIALTPKTISIKGFSQEACYLTKEEQMERGYANVHVTDLVLAHAAYFLATKEDLFNRHISRALEADLSFYRAGLAENPSVYDIHRYKIVTASHYVECER